MCLLNNTMRRKFIYYQVSDALLEPEKGGYIERFADLLEFWSPRLLLPTGMADYSSGTVSLVTIKILLNLAEALVFPQSFDALLHSAPGNCFIA